MSAWVATIGGYAWKCNPVIKNQHFEWYSSTLCSFLWTSSLLLNCITSLGSDQHFWKKNLVFAMACAIFMIYQFITCQWGTVTWLKKTCQFLLGFWPQMMLQELRNVTYRLKLVLHWSDRTYLIRPADSTDRIKCLNFVFCMCVCVWLSYRQEPEYVVRWKEFTILP